jgi:hypothetical protein
MHVFMNAQSVPLRCGRRVIASWVIDRFVAWRMGDIEEDAYDLPRFSGAVAVGATPKFSKCRAKGAAADSLLV